MQRAYATRGLRFLPKLTLAITAGLITAAASYAVDVFTESVGFVKEQAGTAADTVTVVPFTQIDAYRGVVGSVSGNVITDNGSPGWTAGQWMFNPGGGQHNTYYAIFTSGANVGAYYIITNNAAGSLSVELIPTSLGSVSPGDTYRIYPFWTLNTVWPNGQGVVASPSTLSKKTEVLFPAIGVNGINQPPSPTYFFLQSATATNWAVVGGIPASSNVNDQIILPDQYVIVRQQNGASTTTNITLGQVPSYPIQTPLYTQAAAPQDNFVSVYRPAAQSLAQSGLSNSVVISTQLSHKDLVLVLSPNGQAANAPANQTYFFVNPTGPSDSGWRLVGSVPSTADAGSSNVFALGQGVIVRKVATNATVVLWNNLPNY